MRFWKDNRVFLWHVIVWFTAIGIALCLVDKATLHLSLNALHTAWLDTLLVHYSTLVNWAPYVLIVILLFYKVGDALFILAAHLLSTIVVQITKYTVCAPRPASFFEGNADFQQILIDGVRLHEHLSFPSGHTATFFSILFAVAVLFCHNKKDRPAYQKDLFATMCFYLALLGGYSRIYMSQHFLLDVFAGGLIAVISVGIVYWFVQHFALNERVWWNQPVALSKRRK